jgi:hypothetical protein
MLVGCNLDAGRLYLNMMFMYVIGENGVKEVCIKVRRESYKKSGGSTLDCGILGDSAIFVGDGISLDSYWAAKDPV